MLKFIKKIFSKKNIVKQDIVSEEDIHIGDTIKDSNFYNEKNIVKGKIITKGNIHIGDKI